MFNLNCKNTFRMFFLKNTLPETSLGQRKEKKRQTVQTIFVYSTCKFLSIREI